MPTPRKPVSEPTFEVVGDDLVVTHASGQPVRLSLQLGGEALDRWLTVVDESIGWRDEADRLRFEVMPDYVRSIVDPIHEADAIFAVQVIRQWSKAVNDRLGKALGFSSAGDTAEEPSSPTSENASD